MTHNKKVTTLKAMGLIMTSVLALTNCASAQHVDDHSELGADTSALQGALVGLQQKDDLPALGVYADVVGKPRINLALGVRRVGDSTGVTVTDQFHFGSDGKAMTAALLAMLVENHKLRWDSTLGELFPDIIGTHPDFRRVTVEMLLAHRSGIVDGPINFVSGKELSFWITLEEPDLAPAQGRQLIAEHFLTRKPAYTPGTQFSYSNFGYAIAGAIIDRLSGASYEETLPARLWLPLHMDGGCGFGAPANPHADKPDQPWGHRPGVLWGVNAVHPGRLADNPAPISSAGRMHCSMADWSKFLVFLRDGLAGRPSPLLGPASFTKLFTPYPGSNYTYGAWVQFEAPGRIGSFFVHSGSNLSEYAVVAIIPSESAALIAVTNRGGDAAGEATKKAIEALNRAYFSQALLPVNRPFHQ